jgi:hypothetical protein
MFPAECLPTRRDFLKSSAAFAVTFPAATIPSAAMSPDDSEAENVVGPRKGYSPQIGTLVSQMIWMRGAVLSSVKGMGQKELDFLLDDKANTIGALLLHLAATDRIYQILTFENNPMKDEKDAPADFKEKFAIAMDLGEPARKTIKGHNLDYYLTALSEVREKTFAEFRKRDDKWLATIDKTWGWGPTNNYCKWFHVCEHESNHNGQIKLLRGRIPGFKAPSE